MNSSILVISPVPTHPPFAGNRNAILSYSNLFSGKGCKVDFLYVDTTNNISEIEMTKKYWGKNYYHFGTNGWFYRKWFHRKLWLYRYKFRYITKSYNVDDWFPSGLEKYVDELQSKNKYDVVIINYIWLTKIFDYLQNVKKVLFTHDVFSDRFQKTKKSNFSVRPSEEAKALDRCNLVLSIQDEESEYFRSLTKTEVVTTYSPAKFVSTDVCNKQILLFLAGPNDYNTDGIIKFIKQILPGLKDEYPDLNLIIGGGICKRPEIKEHKDNVTIYGEIDDISEFFALSDFVINPVYAGTGLKIKNIEALSYQKIIICHPHNAEGMYKGDKAPINVAESINDYKRSLRTFFNSKEPILNFKVKIELYMNEYNDLVNSRFESIFN